MKICHCLISFTCQSKSYLYLQVHKFIFHDQPILYFYYSGLPTNYHRSIDSFSCNDLSFCFSSVVLGFTWSRLSSFWRSDHYPILLSEVHPSGSSRWNFDRADWVGFSLATEISTSPSSFASVDAALGFFNELIPGWQHLLPSSLLSPSTTPWVLSPPFSLNHTRLLHFNHCPLHCSHMLV